MARARCSSLPSGRPGRQGEAAGSRTGWGSVPPPPPRTAPPCAGPRIAAVRCRLRLQAHLVSRRPPELLAANRVLPRRLSWQPRRRLCSAVSACLRWGRRRRLAATRRSPRPVVLPAPARQPCQSTRRARGRRGRARWPDAAPRLRERDAAPTRCGAGLEAQRRCFRRAEGTKAALLSRRQPGLEERQPRGGRTPRPSNCLAGTAPAGCRRPCCPAGGEGLAPQRSGRGPSSRSWTLRPAQTLGFWPRLRRTVRSTAARPREPSPPRWCSEHPNRCHCCGGPTPPGVCSARAEPAATPAHPCAGRPGGPCRRWGLQPGGAGPLAGLAERPCERAPGRKQRPPKPKLGQRAEPRTRRRR
mmetsp:Transcript_4186/g.17690  ORF Transcript_4186/g.17690 Transcript_4186/m.17690 type:complete len:358 (-) Transcript_4186:1058-2131(-)